MTSKDYLMSSQKRHPACPSKKVRDIETKHNAYSEDDSQSTLVVGRPQMRDKWVATESGVTTGI